MELGIKEKFLSNMLRGVHNLNCKKNLYGRRRVCT